MVTELLDITNYSFIILVLFIFSGFFSGSEAAIFSLNQFSLKKIEETNPRIFKILSYLLSDAETILITIIFANLVVNTLISSIITIFAIAIAKHMAIPPEVCTLLATILNTYLLILLCEVTPINLALITNESFSKIAAYPIYLLTKFFSKIIPVIPIIKKITKIIIPYFGIELNQNTTEQEIISAINIGEREGTIKPEEKHMINSIFEFGNTITKEIMTPRIDMICVRADCTIENVINVFRDVAYSRLPVYENNIDNIIGIIHAKDLLAYLKDPYANRKLSVKAILRQAYFVPETKKIDELLIEFQEKKIQMAIVVDEYGGTEGLVTMEDIVEEIVGEIFDEYDEDEILYEKIDMNTYKINPKISISEFNKLLNASVPEELCDTLGGLLYDLIGHIPSIGEEVMFENIKFKVLSVEGKRIKEVLVKYVNIDNNDNKLTETQDNLTILNTNEKNI